MQVRIVADYEPTTMPTLQMIDRAGVCLYVSGMDYREILGVNST